MKQIKRFFGTPLSYRTTFWDFLVIALLITGLVTWIRWVL